jgi:mono/diheme cytochrome c family protein
MTARMALVTGALALAVTLVVSRSGPRVVAAPAGNAKKGEDSARRLCIGCHAPTPPDVLPRASWRNEMVKMTLIAEGKGMPGWGEPPPQVVLSPDYEDILAYYESKAPAALPSPDPWPPPEESPLRFVRRSVRFPEALTPEPAVANVRLGEPDGGGTPEILACDMRQGLVLSARLGSGEPVLTPIAQVPHPAHVSVVDVDADGRRDLLVADLGEFFPGDHERGAAVVLRARPGGGYAATALDGFPRVADVEAGDFDGDGRLDLLVAAFGWWKKGQIALLLNRPPSFERTIVDRRAGPIHVVPTDLDGDGKLDFVALIAQEHEAVVAFLGDGRGGFQARTLYAGPHPNWGSSGLQLADLDGDGDLDVIVTNGDMFDDDILKPYHGVQWLENRGGLRFEPHALAHLAGAHRAVAADVDGDGDLDVVVSAFTGVAGGNDPRLPALVWLEQVKRGRFVRHTIAVGRPSYPTLDVGDIDADGDQDVVTGIFLLKGTSEQWLDLWENQKRTPAAPR